MSARALKILPLLAPDPVVERPIDIVAEVCARYGITFEAIRGPARNRYHSTARRALVVALRERTPMSVIEIAEVIGRDHTTVSYLSGRRRR